MDEPVRWVAKAEEAEELEIFPLDPGPEDQDGRGR